MRLREDREDFLTKKQVANNGEIPQYYVENNHEAIIDPEVFDMVQRELARRTPGRNRHSGVHLFSGRIVCGVCGSTFGSKVWHSNSKYRRVIWQCNHKYEGDEVCGNTHLTDTQVEEAFLSAVNKLLENRDSIHRDFQKIKKKLYSTAGLEKERVSLEEEMNVASGLIDQLIAENTRKAQDQAECQRRYDELVNRFEAAKDVLAQVTFVDGRRVDILDNQQVAGTLFSMVDAAELYILNNIRRARRMAKEDKGPAAGAAGPGRVEDGAASIAPAGGPAIRDLIYTVRGTQVMLDSDLAMLYQVETGALNRAAKRNEDRFPEDFRFRVTRSELDDLRCQIGILAGQDAGSGVGRTYLPYAYTEQGVAMLHGPSCHPASPS